MKYLSCLLVCFSFFACTKEHNFSSDFRLTAEIYGGWCGAHKQVIVDEQMTKIVITQGKCDGNDSTATYKTDLVKFNNLKAKLEQVKFNSLQLHECGRCKDNIDYKISVFDNGDEYVNVIEAIYQDEDLTAQQQALKELQRAIDAF